MVTTPAIAPGDMTADQLALRTSARVTASTAHGPVVGGRVRNGVQVFLNVPYGLDVPRWADPAPLPPSFRYTGEYTADGAYCAQPGRSYTAHIPLRDRLGGGTPTENPFFADIYVPSGVDLAAVGAGHPRLPVRVFIHGGFLQFGSTSGQYNQQFFAAEARTEVRVLLAHRLSALGFLASARAGVHGNYGFKDVWLGLEWVREHIGSFGGDPASVHLSGLSGGAHVVHQLLHRAAALSPARAPFATALLQSNAILADAVAPRDREAQFGAFCRALGADPDSPAILAELRDTRRFPTAALVAAVEAMGHHSTFRGVVEPGWIRADQMAFQRGPMGQALAAAGVRAVLAGDVRDEAAFYALVHDVSAPEDLLPNVARYYPEGVAARLLAAYEPLGAGADAADCAARLGRALADGQVHLPVRVLCRDLARALPTIRYAVELVPRALGTRGVVTHGSDTALQHLRRSVLAPDEEAAAVAWHDALWGEAARVMDGTFVQRPDDEVLLLAKDGQVRWAHDWRWEQLRAVEAAVLG
ncbi:hypothetical protein Q8F55_007795 [Vanrija albida]|uniref:Carboxylic ester hydrolase n=1 Tax=Vanrija albida TaxID=181172 RepID=A0ABR3PUS2_9TREE